jgi:hypothetical protein
MNRCAQQDVQAWLLQVCSAVLDRAVQTAGPHVAPMMTFTRANRGWDGGTNIEFADAFISLWRKIRQADAASQCQGSDPPGPH